jgi:hypothetical protein
MATSLVITAELKLAWQFDNVVDISTITDSQSYKERQALTNGTSDNQASDMHHDRLYLTPAAATATLDLAGSLTNVFGETLTFTKIRQLIIINKGVPDASHETWTPTAGEYIHIGGSGAADAWDAMFNSDIDAKIVLPSGGMFCATAPMDGWTVSAGTADKLQIQLNGGGVANVDVDVIIVGTD